jgi:DNA-binding NtrC family response regulator
MTARILFVDDDPQLLASLRSVLRRDRQRWDMVFALGSGEAHEELARGEFDLVVSDLRMPRIDGIALLEHVRAQSPRTKRLMLSGTADLDDVGRAEAVAHELLCKPCPLQELRAAISRWLAPASLD